MKESPAKSARLLQLYSHLVQGKVLPKQELAQKFHVTVRSIQRDMESLRCFFADEGLEQDVVYDRKQKGYVLVNRASNQLTNPELLALCKILLESRSLTKKEMTALLDKLLGCSASQQSRKELESVVSNELFHYIEPHHGKEQLDLLWTISQATIHQEKLEIEYQRMKDHSVVKRVVEPVGVMFSEYYFYLTAFLPQEKRETFSPEDAASPTIYRIDRIQSCKVLKEHFHVPYKDRFEAGEFRKRVQFMYGGKLLKVKFWYSGPDVEAVLDRLPTAQVLGQSQQGILIEAEVFGLGIEMWLRSQGHLVQVLEPQELVDKLEQGC